MNEAVKRPSGSSTQAQLVKDRLIRLDDKADVELHLLESDQVYQRNRLQPTKNHFFGFCGGSDDDCIISRLGWLDEMHLLCDSEYLSRSQQTFMHAFLHAALSENLMSIFSTVLRVWERDNCKKEYAQFLSQGTKRNMHGLEMIDDSCPRKTIRQP